MTHTHRIWTIAGLAVASLAVAAWAAAPAGKTAGCGAGGCGMMMAPAGAAGEMAKASGPTCKGDCAAKQGKALTELGDSLAAAQKALAAGDAKAATEQIAKAQELLAGFQKHCAAHAPAAAGPKGAEGAVVNVKCPIMGSKIDPAKTPASLTREFSGQKVGFCCGGCPAAWDKLTDAQKAAKLESAMK